MLSGIAILASMALIVGLLFIAPNSPFGVGFALGFLFSSVLWVLHVKEIEDESY